jgi:hypothetical protein
MKILRHSILFFLAIFFLNQTNAQLQFSGWLASFNTFKLNNKFSLHFDGQLRSTDKWQQVQSILLRPGLNYHLNKTWMFTAGYAYIANRRSVNSISDLLPEHRIWQQALASHKLKKVLVSHRFRFEERFISKATVHNNELKIDGHETAFRLRYFIRNIVPFTRQALFTKGLFFALQNEVFINTGDKSAVNGKTFDQNRLYAAIGYRLPGKIDMEAGYMNQYTSTRTSFINNHIAQIAVYKRL